MDQGEVVPADAASPGIRILWSSNSPLCSSGYAGQTRLFVPRLIKLGHVVQVFAWYGVEGSILNWEGINLLPKYQEPYGQDITGAHAQGMRADIVLTLIDAWVLQPQNYNGIPWVGWAPVDHDPIPPLVAEKLKEAFAPIAYSKFGEAKMREAGLEPLYVPHGIETGVFKPKPRLEARKALGMPTDRFVCGMVAANTGWPSRKAIPEVMAAFARFRRKHDDALLYLHMRDGAGAMPGTAPNVDVHRIAAQYGLRIGQDVLVCEQYKYIVGAYPDEHMVNVFNSLDVLVNPSLGEGFGLTILEAQSCGTPVIVGDWTSMSELCFSGWMIPKEEAAEVWSAQNSLQWVARVGAIAERMKWAYQAAGDESLREKARAGALLYDADTVTAEYWKPALDTIAVRLAERNAPKMVAGPLVAE